MNIQLICAFDVHKVEDNLCQFFILIGICNSLPLADDVGAIFVTGKSTYEPCYEKTRSCIWENKGADQLRGNCEADQRLCFHYMDSTFPLVPKYKISSL